MLITQLKGLYPHFRRQAQGINKRLIWEARFKTDGGIPWSKASNHLFFYGV